MPKTKRKIDYLRLRPGSSNWTIRLQYPDGRDVVRSLGTPDRRQAEIIAGPMITAHKAALLAARPRLVASWQHAYEPGREHVAPDGARIIATDRELIHIGHNGAITRTEPNGFAANRLENFTGTTTRDWVRLVGPNFDRLKRPAVAVKSGDDAILETYLKHANVTGYYEREARAVWALFKTLCDKPLKDAGRDDGRKLVAHFVGDDPENPKVKSATITKKIGWLTAAVNLAIKEGHLKFNPFSGVVPQRDDAQRRLPLSDADIAECKIKLAKLSTADQLLIRILATTGMRLSEAFQIDGEGTEGGVRFVIVGKKTDQSLRRVPLPRDLLPYLPKAIKSQLFPRIGTLKRTSDAASKRLMRFLRKDCGITDTRKVIHSLRHRAQDRLRAAECPQDIRWAILGHEEKSVAAGYGEGFAVTLLRKWADKIGF
jgi:integrase